MSVSNIVSSKLFAAVVASGLFPIRHTHLSLADLPRRVIILNFIFVVHGSVAQSVLLVLVG